MIVTEGYPFVIVSAIVAIIASLFLGGWGGLAFLLPAYSAWFFRNPHRVVPAGDHRVVAPADGRIIQIAEVQETRYLNRSMLKVSIFMSPLDVHVNRNPVSGEVRGVFYNKGRFFGAFREKASLDNEQNAVLLGLASGEEVLVVQIAGFLARRIVCYLKKGERVVRGERYGLIRFGSRLDLYLPTRTEISVKVGERARGGETILGELR